MKECYLYKKLKHEAAPATSESRPICQTAVVADGWLTMAGGVQCQTCHHQCIISDGKRGICGIRENQGGKLYLLTYGRACAENIDPIEKKPLFHFLPHTQTLTIATVGCNFRCQWCQNYDISQGPKDPTLRCKVGECDWLLPPAKIVSDAIKADCPSISYSYTEPTVYLEYALDTMRLAHKEHLKNIWVSNGYMSDETLKLIIPYLDAANIDIKTIDEQKFAKYCGAKDPDIVLENCKKLVKKGIHLETTTLIIPTVNDDIEQLGKIAQSIHDELGNSIPWHLSCYFPAYKMFLSPTSISKLEQAQEIGKKVGLKYVYLGNV